MRTHHGTIVTMKTYLLIASVVFLLVAIAHAMRLVCGSTIMLGTWNVPMWVSIVGVVVAGGLSIQGFKFANKPR